MLRRFVSEAGGGIAVLASVGGAFACLIAGVVIDGGSLALEARRVQAAADLAALAAARDIAKAQAAATATVVANVGQGASVAATPGVYLAQRDLAPGQRFKPAPALNANAVEVRVTKRVPLWLASLIGKDSVRVSRVGRAARVTHTPMAMISIGSRLASVDGGLANQVLGGLTGSTVSLTAVDYRGLADAKVNLLAFTEALSTELNIQAGAYDALLAQSINAGRALTLLAATSEGADAALQKLAHAASRRNLKIEGLIGLDLDAPEALRRGLDAEVTALDLATALIEVASGERQVKLDLGAQAGVADMEAWLAIGERPNRSPWLAVDGDGGITIRTAQARLYLEVRTARALSVGLISLPLLVEGASAEARLADLECSPAPMIRVDARPGPARLRIGKVDPARLSDFRSELSVQPAKLVDVAGAVRVTGQSDLNLTSSTFTRLTFDEAAIRAAAPQTVRASNFTANGVTGLLARLQLDVKLLGIGLGLGGLASEIATVLAPLGPVLDPLIDAVLASAGVGVGEADVAVLGIACGDRPGAPVLVG